MTRLVLTDDWYTKIVLTVIAFALLLIGLNPWIQADQATAEGPMSVVIADVDGGAFDGVNPIEVDLTKPIDVHVVKGTW